MANSMRQYKKFQKIPRCRRYPTRYAVQSQTEDGHVMLVTVKDVQEDKVIVDANHPLAGKTSF